MNSYRDLIVWQKARLLVKVVYLLVKKLPRQEQFALSDQIRRATVSIVSNIAEGYQRQTTKEYIQFLYMSYGSCAELETQLLLCQDLAYLAEQELQEAMELLVEVEKMLNSLIRKLKTSNTKS